jgi:gliding motility-associated-like protein
LSIYTDVTTYSLEIFNRWGTKVYETADKNAGWDGLINGQDAPVGVYMYRLRYKSIQGDSKDIQGSLTLLR